MKNTALAELRAKSGDELKKMADDLRDQLFRGRLTASVEGKGLGGKVRQMRRQVARLETIIREQSAGIAHPAKQTAASAPAPKPKKAKAPAAAASEEKPAKKKAAKKSKDNA